MLDVVRTQGHLGRTEIARRAHLTPQAVTNIVGELVAENLLIELGRLRAGRGQPPIQFAVNPDGPMTAGIEIAADHIVIVLLDLSGRVRAQSIRPVANTSPAHILADLRQAVDILRQSVPGIAVNLLGVGLVMPGPFEIEGMSSVGPATLPGWTGLDTKALASEAIGEPVEIENDATAAAVGERLYGAGQPFPASAMSISASAWGWASSRKAGPCVVRSAMPAKSAISSLPPAIGRALWPGGCS